MVSGTHWPDGDPFLQRQNEPSIAVSSRNSQHLLAGANDYRTVDLSLILNGTGDDAVIGDAWVGIFKSFDGGQTWRSTVLPGCPYPVPQCQGSVIGGRYQAGADPTVRAGTNGMFYYSAIAFNRETSNGAYFVSRFIDDNNQEGATADTIRFLDASIVDSGNSGHFIDKPWIAVDVPRAGAGTCSIPGSGSVTPQLFPAGNVYVAYSRFTGGNDSAKIYFSRSTDCGQTWSNPTKVSAGTAVAQGATIAVDPVSGAVYVAWRQFKADTDQLDSILVSKSTNGGQTFGKAVTVANIIPFDAAGTPSNFRTLTFPTMAVDGSGRVYVAWSARQTAFGDARIMLSSSADGNTWSPATPVDPPKPLYGMSFQNPQLIQPGLGHQIMPSMSVNAGKVAVLYYSMYEDSTVGEMQLACPPLPEDPLCSVRHSIKDFLEVRKPAGTLLPLPASAAQLGTVFGPWIQDATPANSAPLLQRHTIDVRVAIASVGQSPLFTSTRVSQYPFGSPSGANGFPPKIQQLRENPPNLPLFVQGTQAFIGDYIDLNAQNIVPGSSPGTWSYDLSSANPSLRAVWTDNRDIRPPADGDWTHYTPSIAPAVGPAPGVCLPGQAGMRNQNIYFARITGGLSVSAPGDSKQLTTAFPRAFSIVVQNNTDQIRSYRLTIANQPVGGQASFAQTSFVTTIDATAAPRSSISRSVFVTSTDAHAQVSINVVEISAPNGSIIPGGQQSSLLLNPDLTNPDLTNPDLTNGDIRSVELYVPDLTNPDLTNPDLTNPDLTNPDLTNPDLTNPDLTNPDLTNLGVARPDLTNPDLTNPDLTNPDLTNADIQLNSLTDVTWTIKNQGNTTASFAIRLVSPFGRASLPEGFKTQMILHKSYATPALSTTSASCQVVELNQAILVANIVNPTFFAPVSPDLTNPDLTNPDLTNATISVAPGENAYVSLRVQAPTKAAAVNFINTAVQPAVIAQAANTDGSSGPTPKISLIVATLAAPNGQLGTAYSLQLQAVGGTAPYTWTLDSGSLPPGLGISPSGLITGTPTALGSFTFRVKAVDSGTVVESDTQDLTIVVTNQPSFLVAQTSAPAATVGQPYNYIPTVTSGTGPFTWTFFGNLPPGLSPNSNTGAITGTPTAAGTFNGYFVVKDSTGQMAVIGVSITIANVPTVFVVSGSADSGPGSLRQAMINANSTPLNQPALIRFSIGGGGPYVIAPQSALPVMTRPVTIDATTQPGYAGNPVVQLDGTNAGTGTTGLILSGGYSAVRGFSIVGFDGSGIGLQTSGGNTIKANYIGLDTNGAIKANATGNNAAGIFMDSSSNNVIGGATAPERNVISGNGPPILGDANASAAIVAAGASTANTLKGNYIGTNPAGTGALGNTGAGVALLAGSNTVGGPTVGERNVISGNRTGIVVIGVPNPPNFPGVLIAFSGSSSNTIQNNYIGLDVTGTIALGTADVGLDIIASTNNTVSGNVISGSGSESVDIEDGASNNRFVGNYVGTNAAGTAALGNAGGVHVSTGANNNIIGGSTATERNVISGNNDCGVSFGNTASPAFSNSVQGNFIGTDVTGTVALQNTNGGVCLNDAINNTIGGSLPGQGNVISGNNQSGVTFWGSQTTGNVVIGNYIGTDATGTTRLGNVYGGVALLNGAHGNTIGGTTAAERNVISGNHIEGVHIEQGLNVLTFANNNAVQGNYIGTNAAGTAAIPNSCGGMFISGFNNLISGNLVSGNRNAGTSFYSVNPPAGCPPNSTATGISIGSTGTGNVIQGNIIGLNSSGTALPNESVGVGISGPNNTLGGMAVGARNVVSGNGNVGVFVGGTSNTIQGNFIGLNVAGSAGIANTNAGISINSTNNTVNANVVSGNTGSGIVISGTSTTGNHVTGNLVGTDVTGTLSVPNTNAGIQILQGSNNVIGGPNPSDRNIVSGGAINGISIRSGATNNLVQGNYVGTTLSGTAALANGGWGIIIGESSTNTVTDNLVSGNALGGVLFVINFAPNVATGNVIKRNKIGTNPSGTSSLPNNGPGVFLATPNTPGIPGTANTTIGGSNPADANIIAFNNGQGVSIASGVNNQILSNSIFSNTGIGIDLGADGVTANDAVNPDIGVNNRQNYPVLSTPTVSSASGEIFTAPNTDFTVQLFSSTTSNHQGQTLLTTVVVHTDAAGHAFIGPLSLTLTSGQWITATATDPSGNTSEFSTAVQVP
jgi:hypothetical protein